MSKFWNEKIRLRLYGKIPKVWSVEDLYTHLDGIFARGTLTMFPLNQSVTRDGAGKGYYVKEADRLWPTAFPARTSDLIEDNEV
jgi:hypothetical protein